MTRNFTFFRKLSLFLFIFITCIIFVQSEYEVTKLPGHRFSTDAEISSFLNKTDVTVLVFYYKKESDKSNEIAKNLKVVYSKLLYLVDFVLVDCDKSSIEGCKTTEDDDYMEDAFYRIEMYVPPQYKYNPYTKELNQHQKLQYAKTDVSDKAIIFKLKVEPRISMLLELLLKVIQQRYTREN